MIVLFTDFGATGPYLGQMEVVLHQYAPHIKVINLLSNAPKGDPMLSSFLLAALRQGFPKNTIFLSVVDPGVGGERRPVVLEADNQFFVGPDNGLFNTIAIHAEQASWYEIIWQPGNCSNSFHGRDLFAPVAAKLANGEMAGLLQSYRCTGLENWTADLDAIIYFDCYGNAMTGLRHDKKMSGNQLQIGDLLLEQAETFCKVKKNKAFWYQNSAGLVEAAVNQGNAKAQLNLELGMQAKFV